MSSDHVHDWRGGWECCGPNGCGAQHHATPSAMERAEARIAELEATAEGHARQAVAAWMLANSFATGHGDTLADLLSELTWQVAELRAKVASRTNGDADSVATNTSAPRYIKLTL